MSARRLFFVLSLVVCLSYVSTRVLGMGGLSSTPFEAHCFGQYYFHGGIDIYAGESTSTQSPGDIRRVTFRARTRCTVEIPQWVLAYQYPVQTENLDVCMNAGVEVAEGNGQYLGLGHSYLFYDADMSFPPTPTQSGAPVPTPFVKAASNLSQLNWKIQAALRYEAALRHYDQGDFSMWPIPSGVQITTVGGYKILKVADVLAGAEVAVVGNFCAYADATTTATTTVSVTAGNTVTNTITNTIYTTDLHRMDIPSINHFHVNVMKNGILNLGGFRNILPFLRGMLPDDTQAPVASGPFYFRPNNADFLRSPLPADYANGVYYSGAPNYVQVEQTDDPLLEMRTVNIHYQGVDSSTEVYGEVDIIKNIHDMWGRYYANSLSKIEFKIVRKEHRCLEIFRQIDDREVVKAVSTPYVLPTMALNDFSYGATFPPYCAPGSTEMAQGVGQVWEFNPMGNVPASSASPWLPFSYSNSVWNEQSDVPDHDEIVHNFWILTNQHCLFDGQFRLNTSTDHTWKDSFYGWNTQVNNEFKNEGDSEPLWWLPRMPNSYPTTTPIDKPQNADFPEEAHFDDGRYFIELKAEDAASTPNTTTVYSGEFNVNNYKPYLEELTIYQQQVDWDSSHSFIDTSNSSSWILPSTPESSPDDWVEGLFAPWCVYNASWVLVHPEGGGGEVDRLKIKTVNFDSTEENKIVDGKFCDFSTHGSASRLKKWVNGEKPVYLVLRFSEEVDLRTFQLVLEDRYGESRLLLDQSHYVAPNITPDCSFFEYFNWTSGVESAFTSPMDGENRTIIAKIPAFKHYRDALFDGAERRLQIFIADLAGTYNARMVFLEDGEESSVLGRSFSGLNWSDPSFGDDWIHRLSIDSIAKARTYFDVRVPGDNWPDVEEDILNLEEDDSFQNIAHIYFGPMECQGTPYLARAYEYDPRRFIQRQSIDYLSGVSGETWVYDAAGTRETKITIGEFSLEQRVDSPNVRVLVGPPVNWCVCMADEVEIRTFVSDAIGNHETVAGVFWEINNIPPTDLTLSIPYTFTDIPSTFFYSLPTPTATTCGITRLSPTGTFENSDEPTWAGYTLPPTTSSPPTPTIEGFRADVSGTGSSGKKNKNPSD